jgi:hypothetical protein
MSFRGQANRDTVRSLVAYMDRIDAARNEIIRQLNPLLSRCDLEALPEIKLSSDILKKQEIGGASAIAPLLQ